MKSTEIWIGRFDVKPIPGNDVLGVAKGAFVNVVALAEDRENFIRTVAAAMDEYEFNIVQYEDVFLLRQWTDMNNSLNQELELLVRSLSIEFPIQFDEFQSYLVDDA